MRKLPWHVHALINDYVLQLHIIEQRHKFASVLQMLQNGGISQNEDMPDLVDITTGYIIVDPRGWSQRVSESLNNIGP